jgi:FtsH-binding integral membrane protein
MDADRKVLLIKSAKVVVTALVAYAASSVVAATALAFVLDVPGPHVNLALAVVVGQVALPFVLVVKVMMIANQWDGAIPHAIAGAVVGLLASILIAEASHITDVIVFAVIGMLASLAYLWARKLWRGTLQW